MQLKDILSPELYAQVQAAIDAQNAAETDPTKHIRFADLSEGGYVSAAKYKSKTEGYASQIADLQAQITQRDTDMEALRTQLTAAQADASKLPDVQNSLTGLQTKYETDRKDWEARAARQQYEFMVREKANSLTFTSSAAKRDFIRTANEAGFKVDGESLLGYEDFVAKYKTDNPGAVSDPETAAPTPAPATPAVVLPSGSGSTGTAPGAFGFSFSGVRPIPKADN